jgi:hypothetical protein
MASLIRRSDGRLELRESVWTPRGPRGRTLAIFRELTPEVLDHAQRRARTPFDAGQVVARAAKQGVHVKRVLGSREDPVVVSRARRGELWPAFAAALRRELDDSGEAELPAHLEAMLDWLGSSDEERGRALVDLLRLADRIERGRPHRRGPLRFPRLADRSP